MIDDLNKEETVARRARTPCSLPGRIPDTVGTRPAVSLAERRTIVKAAFDCGVRGDAGQTPRTRTSTTWKSRVSRSRIRANGVFEARKSA